MAGERTLMRCQFGSHLYGTATPQSDLDFKGVFLPSERDAILQRVPKSKRTTTGDPHSKNKPGDIDAETYSLHYFLKLAAEGQTVAIDMLHCPEHALLERSEEWSFIRANRRRFYTKRMDAFVGYCRTQAAKYGIKGSRLGACRRVTEFLGSCGAERIADVWEDLPGGEHILKYEEEAATQNDKRIYSVCARKVPATCSVAYAKIVFEKYLTSYGARAKLASENKGIDWKAVSHAFRAGFQLREILLTGDLRFPLAERAFLRDVKSGALHYQNDAIGTQLEDLMAEVEALSAASGLPDQVDTEFWDNFIVGVYAMRSWHLPGLVA